MPKDSTSSSQDTLRPLAVSVISTTSTKEERRKTGRFVAASSALTLTLFALYHGLLRGASTIARIFIPAIIMLVYVLWVLYSARRDRLKALRRASAMQLLNVVSTQPMEDNVTNPADIKNESKDVT
ncbi:uncharacterized protein LOC107269278 isoform X2 [Cephus cinctus]|uniref:Uncharacterized protein LOC107269278 isoform X2 n=1 Tax=Cephus cinctus TaxID=211228 RepID=A0AAJ7W2M9_CEPCN|nr:uncharacterized protein LOC107269278 isoform X2 [Cephus cinctus]